jgi:hypothetical protein
VVQAKSFAKMLEQAVRKYQNRAIEAAQVIEEMIDLAKDMRLAAGRNIEPFPFPFGTRGFDFDSGYGFVDAVAALDEVGD